MQIKLSNEDVLLKEFDIVIPAHLINEKVEGHLLSMAPNVKIAGFRPGKVPLPVLHQKHGEQALTKVLDELMQQACDKVVAEHKIRPAVQPRIRVKDYDKGQDFSFTLSLESLPEIKDVDVSSLSLKRFKVRMDEKRVEETLAMAQKSASTTKEIEKPRKSQKGDVVVIDFKGIVDGKELSNATAQGYELELGKGEFIPGFEEGLIGLKAGEKKTLELKFPDEYHAKELAGKDVQFEVDVKEIRELAPAELSDDLAKKFGFESLADMKKGFEERIGKEYQAVSDEYEKLLLLDELDKKFEFPLPKTMVDIECDIICEQSGEGKEAEHVHDDTQEACKTGQCSQSKDNAALKEKFYPMAERRVKLGLLLSDYGQKNKVEVSSKEITEAVQQEISQYPWQKKQIIDYYSNNQEAVAGLRAQILEEKVVRHILEQSKKEPEEVTLEDLKERMKKREESQK